MNYTLKKLAPSFAISIGIIVLTFVLYLFSAQVIEFSDSELSVTKHKMQVDINNDGSIYVKEDVTISLDSYWNYVIKDIGFAKDDKVEEDLGFSIDKAQSSFDETSFICEVYNEHGRKLQTNISRNYDLDQSKYISYKIVPSSSLVTGTKIHYEYKIFNAVTVYNDIAEFNWILLDYWGYLTSDIDIDINLPVNTNLDSIKFFGHGVSRKDAVEQSGLNFDVDIDKLHKNELIEVRILFDKSSLTNVDSSKVINNDAKQALLTIEDNIAKEQLELAKLYNTSKYTVLSIFGLMLILVINFGMVIGA